MVAIIQRREMVDRVVEKEGAEGMELEKTKRCQQQGLEEWDGVLQGSPMGVSGCWDPNQLAQEAEAQSLQGPFFLKTTTTTTTKNTKTHPFPIHTRRLLLSWGLPRGYDGRWRNSFWQLCGLLSHHSPHCLENNEIFK